MANAASFWAYPLAGAMAGQRVVQAEIACDEVHRISGLDASAPLVVTASNRTSGSIAQTIEQSGETTTVTRTT